MLLCDGKLKGNVFNTTVRPAMMLYGSEARATTKRIETRLEVNEMWMLLGGVRTKDNIRNKHTRGTKSVISRPTHRKSQ